MRKLSNLAWVFVMATCVTVSSAAAQTAKPATTQSQHTKTFKTAGVRGQLRSIKNSDRMAAAKLAAQRRAAARAQGKSVTPVLNQEVKK